jgi:hypothetical protein
MSTLRTALVALSIAIAAPVAAQDFTSMDLAALNGPWSPSETSTKDIIAQTVADPQVRAMYDEAVKQGYTGPIEQFAYDYASVGGFTTGATAPHRWDISGIDNPSADISSGYINSTGVSILAYDCFANMHRGGGQSFYYSYFGLDGNQGMPLTWATNTYQYYGGNTYYVDQHGQCWIAHPNGSGQWYGLNN